MDYFSSTIPTKGDGKVLNSKVLGLINKLEGMKVKQKELEEEEQRHFRESDRMDRKILDLTFLETGIILFSFLIEYLSLSNYLRRKEIV